MQTTTLSHPHPCPPAPGCTLEVAPGVHWLRLALPWSLDHINLWLLEDGAGLCLVDTGLGDEPTRTQLDQVFAARTCPLGRIIATHYHPDHLGNAEWLAQRSGAEVWMATGEYLLAQALFHQTPGHDVAAMLAHFRLHGLDEVRLERLAARGNVFRRGVPTLPAHYNRLADGDVITIGGRRWRCIVGYGHSPEHIALYCDEARLLISGDMLLPRITTNVAVPASSPNEDAVGRFLASIDRFADLPADTLVLPAHGLPFVGVHARIGQLHAHHQERDATMQTALEQACCAADLLSTLFRRELDPHQVMFAMSETIAHLNHLWQNGGARRFDDHGRLRFQACQNALPPPTPLA
ncbi:MBL fold metallo-hydrolase [Uliginosibacterium gangwonense]|uniref:MBL fold metallo-hydrolase n=1 Tax=Uliginosibacterium gangwonense TaxID=392736 RepID=UPI00036287E9|nr:MBL fold metallo-hydrolase [Uliginosibacterium gangwonense]